MDKIYLYQPGNGSKYKIGIFQVNNKKSYIVTWLKTENSGTSFYFKSGDKFNLNYICEKMDIDIADAAAIMTFTQRMAPIVVTDLFQWQAVLGKWNIGSA